MDIIRGFMAYLEDTLDDKVEKKEMTKRALAYFMRDPDKLAERVEKKITDLECPHYGGPVV